MYIGVLPRNISWTNFRKKTKDMTFGVYVVKGTDAIVIKTVTDRAFYIYSKNSVFNGNRSNDNILDRNLYNMGYRYNGGLYHEDDFVYFFARLRNSSFSTADVKKLAKEAIKRTSLCEIKQRYPEYGVELELETDGYMSNEEREEICNSSSLIHDVGEDGSVHNGCEIRFNHPSLSGWKMKDIKLIMNTAKSLNAGTSRGTAGMHIHISRKDIRDIVKKFEDNLPVMQQILYPTNCRKLRLKGGSKMYYGVESNIYRNQLYDFGTLEIRAWNATLDPKLFLARIKFCKYFCDWLADAKEITVDKFFESLKGDAKKNYMFMVNHAENPHQWGMPLKAVNAMLA